MYKRYEQDVKQCFDLTKDKIFDDCHAWDTDLEEYAEFLVNQENNFNNADITSGQRCFEYGDILSALKVIINE